MSEQPKPVEEQPKPVEHYRGSYLPVQLMRLYEDSTLNGEEVLLFIKIDSLQDPKRGGCWASNGWLSVWWNKSPRWVSNTITKFQSLGLVIVIQRPNNERIVVTQMGPRKKTSTPQEESFLTPRKNHSTKVPLREIGIVKSSDDDESLLTPKVPEYSQAVSSFADFSRSRGYHIRKRVGKQVIYTIQGQPGGWTQATLQRWEEIHQGLCRIHHPEKIRRMVLRFIKYHGSDYAPEVRTFQAFADKFEKVEKFVNRERANRIRLGEEDPEEAPYDDPVPEPTISSKPKPFDEAEHRKLVEEIDGDWMNASREE